MSIPLSPETRRRLERVRESVRAAAENRPGVYRIYGPGGRLIYVGKSIRVRTRLLSYFRAPRGEKAAEIAGHAERVEWDYVPSEFAALLREYRLIRRHRPEYNVVHKRQGSVCFVQLGPGPAPKLSVVARGAAERAAAWGPLRGRRRATAAVRDLADVLRLRDCAATTPLRFADQTELFTISRDPLCWRGEIRRCAAPCAGRCSEGEYAQAAAMVRDFFAGGTDAPIERMRRRTESAAERLAFEHAAELRDRTTALERLREEVVTVTTERERLSFLYRVPGWGGDHRVYVLGDGRVLEEHREPGNAAGRRRLEKRAAKLYARAAPAPDRLPADAVEEMLLVLRWFRLHPEERAGAEPEDVRPSDPAPRARSGARRRRGPAGRR